MKNKYSLKPKDASKFNKICSDLNNLISNIQTYIPDSCLYVTPQEIHILSEPDSRHPLMSETILFMDNGDW